MPQWEKKGQERRVQCGIQAAAGSLKLLIETVYALQYYVYLACLQASSKELRAAWRQAVEGQAGMCRARRATEQVALLHNGLPLQLFHSYAGLIKCMFKVRDVRSDAHPSPHTPLAPVLASLPYRASCS